MRKPCISFLLIILILSKHLCKSVPVQQTQNTLRTQMNPNFLKAIAAYKRLETKLPREELRAITTIGILNGAKQVEQQMEQNLVEVVKDLLLNTNMSDKSNVFPKIEKIEDQLERDHKALDILTRSFDIATKSKDPQAFRQEMLDILKTVKDPTLAENVHRSSESDVGKRVGQLRKQILKQVDLMKTVVDDKIDYTLEYLVQHAPTGGPLATAGDKVLKKRQTEKEEPARIRQIKSILIEDDFRNNLVDKSKDKSDDEDDFDDDDNLYLGAANNVIETNVSNAKVVVPATNGAIAALPQPGNIVSGVPQPIGQGGVFPQPGSALPQPGGAIATLPQPGGAIAALPQPGRAIAALPQPGGAIVGLPQPGGAIAAFPQPNGSGAVFPQPGGVIAAFPQPGNIVPAFPQPSGAGAIFTPPITITVVVNGTANGTQMANQEEGSPELLGDDDAAPAGGGGGGGLVGIISSLSGGEGGSDIGALLGALTGLISQIFGPGGLDIESLISSGTSLIAGLLSGDKNFGTVLGIYVGTAFDGLSGGGGAINNGQFIGNFLGTVVASLSADPEEDDQPPKPLIFLKNLVSSFVEAKNRPLTEEDSERKDKDHSHGDKGGGGGSDSSAFIKQIVSHVVGSLVSVLLNAALGASGGASHASHALFGASSAAHNKPAPAGLKG